MKKGILILILLILSLFSVSCIYAADVDDALAANEDTGEIELSHEIESADNNLGTIEEQTVTQTDSEEKTGATDDGTFEALNSKIESASSGDTVYLENNYSCEDSWTRNTGINIDKSNLVIDGQGHTIDAKQKTRIFYVYHADNVTIKNIKFINAKVNSENGGAIYWSNSANGSVSGCSFVNCSAKLDGGAIEWSHSDGGCVSGCSFVNCSAAAGGAIDWYMSANGNISDCAFINNTAHYGRAIYISSSSASLDRNWFGNTAENYKTSPDAYIEGAGLDNWLFLNATVNPDSISTAQTADIIFKLYLYNHFTGITDYTSLVKVDLALNSNGKLDKNVTGLDEKVTFTPTSIGTGSITATIENVAYTTTLTVTTDGTTFWDLNNAINGNANDTINLDRDYAYNPASDSAFTEGIWINRPVTINGNGYTIDAKSQASILWVKGDNVNINNVTFVNGKAGIGGAIYWTGANGAVSGSCFIGNTAEGSGGAIFWRSYNGAVSGCSFINNTAVGNGGAIYWNGDIGCVSDCIFLNNTADTWGVIYANKYNFKMNHCWFGNTADNYDSSPEIGGLSSYDNWLFLNATANPNEVPAFNTSEIVFNLYLYNKTSTTGNISEYDNTLLLPINLTITSTNGNVDNHTANLGDSITYTPTGFGDASVTATIENVACTIALNNLKVNPNLSAENQVITYGENATIALNYNNTATGKINITLTGKKGTFTYQNLDLNATIMLPDNIPADEYNVTVSYSGDENFQNATANATLTINKADSTLTINDNVTFDYNTNGSTTVSYTNATGVNASVVGQPNAIVVVNDTTITVSGLNAGNYTLTVTTITDANHNNVTKTASITVNKVDSILNVDDVVLDYGTSANVTVTTEGATGITAKINDKEAVVENNTISIPVLDAGTYTLTVTAIADSNHNNITKNVTITVNKLKTQINAKAVTATYNVNKNLVITLKDANGKALSGFKLTVKIKGSKTYTTDKNGQIKINVAKLVPKKYTAKITFAGNTNYAKSTADVKVTVKKAKAKIFAKKKTYKANKKSKKFKIKLKDKNGKAIKKAKVRLIVKKIKKTGKSKNKKSEKKYKKNIKKTNKKGKITFKIKRNKKGKYLATVKFYGNKYYAKAVKKVKIKMK